MKMNKSFRRLLSGFLALALVLALLPAQLSVAETNPPTSDPQDAPGPEARWSVVGNGKYVYVNGFAAKPSVFNHPVSPGDGTQTMNVDFKMRVTNLNGNSWLFRNSQRVDQVSYKRYGENSSGWPVDFKTIDSSAFQLEKDEPTTNLSATIPVPTKPGDYYFQLRVRFDHKAHDDKTPTFAYSVVVPVSVRAPGATSLRVEPATQTILWGQTALLTAKTEPTGSVPDVSWTGPREEIGRLFQTTVMQTKFASTTLSDPTSPFALFDNGYEVSIIAKSLASTDRPVGLTATAKVRVGGANPLTVKYGDSIDFTSPIPTDNFPSTPRYKWVIYDEQHKVYTPATDEDAQLNGPTFHWGKVKANRAKKMYYQLQVSFDLGNNQKTTWYSNLAPITITDQPERPNLVAVPNLHFFLDGIGQRTASIADFQRPDGARLFYGDAIVSPGEAFDGNSNGVLKVASDASHWSLSVSFSKFQNMATRETLSNQGEFELSFADGTRVQVKDDNNDVTLYDSQTGPRETKLTKNTTLSFPAMRDVKPGTYQSTATWTLVEAP